jgi:hypothetical protein
VNVRTIEALVVGDGAILALEIGYSQFTIESDSKGLM